MRTGVPLNPYFCSYVCPSAMCPQILEPSLLAEVGVCRPAAGGPRGENGSPDARHSEESRQRAVGAPSCHRVNVLCFHFCAECRHLEASRGSPCHGPCPPVTVSHPLPPPGRCRSLQARSFRAPPVHVTVTMQEHPQSHMWLVVPRTPTPAGLLPVDSDGVVPGARPAAKNYSARLCLLGTREKVCQHLALLLSLWTFSLVRLAS